MAKVDFNGFLLRIELDHDETNTIIDKLSTPGGALGAGGALSAFLAGIGVPLPVIPIVLAAVGAHLAWEIPTIKAADKGHGVILQMPVGPAFVPTFLLMPSTRYEFDNAAWAEKDNNVIGDSEGDTIETKIEHNGDPKVVRFVLDNQCQSGWDKIMVLRNGLGKKWPILAKGHSQTADGLWSEEVKNGQGITFSKPKLFGVWTEMFTVYDLQALQPGSVVTFTWIKD